MEKIILIFLIAVLVIPEKPVVSTDGKNECFHTTLDRLLQTVNITNRGKLGNRNIVIIFFYRAVSWSLQVGWTVDMGNISYTQSL